MSLAEIEQEIEEINLIDAIEKARRDLLAFTLFTKEDYEVNWHHPVITNFIMRWLRKEFRFGMIFTPPRMGKSEIVSRRLPAFIHGIMPNDQIMAASYNDTLASDMTMDVQKIMDEPEYKTLFPNSRILGPGIRQQGLIRNQEEHTLFDIRNRAHRGNYRGQGVGGTFTGRGANKIIGDDLIKGREAAESESFRRKLLGFWDNDLRTRLEKGGQALLTMTRWHEKDLGGALLKRAKENDLADQWEVLSLPAIKDREAPYDIRQMGEPLWPNKYTLKEHLTQKATNPRMFESLMQQNPTSDTGSLFKRKWTNKRYVKLPEVFQNRWDASCVSVDARFKDDKNSGDYVVMDAWVRYKADFYFLAQARGRWSFTETVDKLEEFCKRFPYIRLKLIENKANGPAIENVLKKRIPGIVLVEPQGGKTARVNAVTPFWEAGNVWLPDESIYPGISEIIEEYVSFGPGCAHDDRTDTMSQALNRLGNGLAGALKAMATL